ncbi:MAG: FtsX-like permease family protein, partial [Vicinamibacterales bacterium]
LLLACANVANLLLTRATTRRGEMAMRVALGAGRFRLVRQLLTESLLLAALGAACGVLVAQWATQALLGFIVAPTAPVHATLDVPVLVFTAAVTIAAGMLFGLVPALQASRFDLAASIKARQAGGAVARGGASKALVAIQIALSLVLLVGSLLFARSLANLEGQPLGFGQEHVLLERVSPRLAGYTPQTATAMYLRAYDRLRALPGVRSATFAAYSPFSGSNRSNSSVIEGYTPRPQESLNLETVQIGPDYPQTMGMRLVQGRSLNDKDTASAPLVALVNEAFVHRYFPMSDPIGRRVGLEDTHAPNIEIVGVLADAVFRDARKPVAPTFFPAMLQETSGFALDCEFAVRVGGDPSGAAAEVRGALADVAPDVPLNDPVVLGTQVDRAFNSDRLAARFVAFFGLLALTLACVGLYGTIAQSVAHRTPEIGVRMALGAARPAVLWLILRQTAILLAIGLAVGTPFAVLGGRLIGAQLFGVHPIDPTSLGGAAAALVVASLLASFVPAHRATRIDAVQALRGE